MGSVQVTFHSRTDTDFALNRPGYSGELRVNQFSIAVGTRIATCPRTKPSGPDSGTRLPPWVLDEKATFGPGMKDAWGWQEIGHQCLQMRPPHAILLTTSPQGAQPKERDVISERTETSEVGGHGMVGEISAYHLCQPPTLLRDWFVHAPPQFGLERLQLGPQPRARPGSLPTAAGVPPPRRIVTSIVDSRLPGIPFALCGRLQRAEETIAMHARQLGSNLLHKFPGRPSPRRKAGCPRKALGASSPTHLRRSRTRTAGTEPIASPRPLMLQCFLPASINWFHVSGAMGSSSGSTLCGYPKVRRGRTSANLRGPQGQLIVVLRLIGPAPLARAQRQDD